MGTMIKTEKYDTRTGEVLSSVSKKGVEWVNEDGYLYINKACTHLLGKEVLPLELGNEAIVAFYYFVNLHLGYDNVLLVRDGRNVRYAGLEDLANTLKCSKRQIYRKIKPLFDNNVVIKSRDASGAEYFVVNPVFALFGHRISFRTYVDFIDILSRYLTEFTKVRMDAEIYNKNRLNGGNNE